MQDADTRVPCVGRGRGILWTAEQQRYWYEDMNASVYAGVHLRCDRCRKRGRHDLNRDRSKARTALRRQWITSRLRSRVRVKRDAGRASGSP
jgi:hypothetical protein